MSGAGRPIARATAWTLHLPPARDAGTGGQARNGTPLYRRVSACSSRGQVEMKHPSSQQFFAYWDEVRGSEAAPARSAFEPEPIRHLLGDSFVLAYDHVDGFPFRVAGTRLCALLGSDVKGQRF